MKPFESFLDNRIPRQAILIMTSRGVVEPWNFVQSAPFLTSIAIPVECILGPTTGGNPSGRGQPKECPHAGSGVRGMRAVVAGIS